MMKRSEQDTRTKVGRGSQPPPPREGRERPADQYERDPWPASGSLEPDWRAGRRAPTVREPAEPQERPQRRYPPGPKGYQRSDERLREDISERLLQAHEIDSSEVTVAVLGAKAVVEGTVPQRWMKHAIEDLVDACPGVQDIDNRIRVSR